MVLYEVSKIRGKINSELMCFIGKSVKIRYLFIREVIYFLVKNSSYIFHLISPYLSLPFNQDTSTRYLDKRH